MKNVFAGILFGALLGSIATWLFSRSPSSESDRVQDIQSKMMSLSENEYQQYLQLKDSEEKFKRADELLGRVMLLFLTDLGSRTKGPPTSAPSRVGSAEATPSNSQAAEALPTTPPPANLIPPKNTPSDLAAHDATSPTRPDQRLKAEGAIIAAATEAEAFKALKEIEFTDLRSELSQTKSISDRQLQLIAGKYLGAITFDDQSETWRIEWEMDARFAENQTKGTSVVKLSNSKKTFSTTRGKGTIKDFRAFGGDSQAVLVNVYGDDGYIQILPLGTTGKIVGNYYALQKDESFKRTGVVVLQRMP